MEIAIGFLSQYAIQAPVLLVWIAGLVLSLIHWRRYPRVAIVTFIACLLFILDSLIGTFISLMLPRILIEQGRSSSQIGAAFTVVGIIRSAFHAVLWAAVLFAIFGRRGPVSNALPSVSGGYQPDSGADRL